MLLVKNEITDSQSHVLYLQKDRSPLGNLFHNVVCNSQNWVICLPSTTVLYIYCRGTWGNTHYFWCYH